MKAYFVMVRPNSLDRYTDSLWISLESARRRAEELRQEFIRRGRAVNQEPFPVKDWAAWVSECEIQDAVEVPKNDKPVAAPKKKS